MADRRGFRVLLRVRPPAAEASVLVADDAALEIADGLLLDPDTGRVAWTKHGATKSLGLDGVYPPGAPLVSVFSRVEDSVDAVVGGHDCSIVAYGQKGSGKTFTMSGGTVAIDDQSEPVEELGLVRRSIHALFSRLEAMPEVTFDIQCSCLEIANEKVYDLLAGAAAHAVQSPPRRTLSRARHRRTLWNVHARPTHDTPDLPVLSQPSGAVVVDGLSSHRTATRDEVLDIFQQVAGTQTKRTTHGHLVFILALQRGPEGPPARLFFVDLAGFEAAPEEHTPEASAAHKSLANLAQCVHALAQRRPADSPRHVPYRGSVLTRLLQPTLENARHTTFVLTVTPAAAAFDTTCTTLRLAERLKGIVGDARRRDILPPAPVEAQLLALQLENDRYKGQLEEARTQLAAAAGRERALATENEMLRSHIRASEAMLRRVRLVLTKDDVRGSADAELSPPSAVAPPVDKGDGESFDEAEAEPVPCIPVEVLSPNLQKQLVTIPLPLRVQERVRQASAKKRGALPLGRAPAAAPAERHREDSDVAKLPQLDPARQPVPPQRAADSRHRGRRPKASAKEDEVQLPQIALPTKPASFNKLKYEVLLDDASHQLLRVDEYKTQRRRQLEARLDAPE
ncbi:hypothetical protein ACHHYP_15827 [Achlya hypogyna]|uniref:Kinesin motor domain-containing protein n=1 Tax=Achlya hypogyna TaxID=1202772 RepID=A0A1V9ZEH4_ACHHY|nr:hypothetical protein ACHHYP_15827 [Achlya hypogyna]